MNSFKTALLLGLLTCLLVAIGGMIGGRTGMIIALVLAAGMNFFSYWYSDKIVLKMYKARELSRTQAPEIVGAVKELADNAGLPMPKVYVIDDPTPNAFATGRNPEHAVVAVTSGIVDLLSLRELKGVLAHELGHVNNRDILVSSIAATLAGAVMMLASMARFAMFFGGSSSDDEEGGGGIIGLLLVSILAPFAAMLVQMAVSRSREYGADKAGAKFCHDPLALASALNKLEGANRRHPMHKASEATAHMFIVNPLSGKLAGLFSTHPPIPERVARLEAMAGGSPSLGRRERFDQAREDRFNRGREERKVNLGKRSSGRAASSNEPPPPPVNKPGGKIDWS